MAEKVIFRGREFSRSKPCQECSRSGMNGKLELVVVHDIERGNEIAFALCTNPGCVLHKNKLPLSMYEKSPG